MARILALAVSLAVFVWLIAQAGAHTPLRQSTAVTVKIGPMLDRTTYDAETALTLHYDHIRLSKNGGAFAAKSDANALSHDENGYYACLLDVNDANTLGILTLGWTDANAVPIRHDYEVMPANVWDSLYGSAKLEVNVVDYNDWDDGGRLDLLLDAVKAMTDLMAVVTTTLADVNATDANELTLTAGQDANDAYWLHAIMVEDATDGHSEVRWIEQYVSGRIVTIDEPFSFTPAIGDRAWILGPVYGGLLYEMRTLIQESKRPLIYYDGTGKGKVLNAGDIVYIKD